MLTRSKGLQSLFSNRLGLRAFAVVKDYYKILGLTQQATPEEIKDAYRNLAKKYHPDVKTNAKITEPVDQHFIDISEAYSVLSIPESRLQYDIQATQFPESIYRDGRNAIARDAVRGKDGQTFKEKSRAGSYAEKKLQFLADERKKYNVDYLGRYRGGVPQKGKGNMRGSSLGAPGSFHEPGLHNDLQDQHPDYHRIDQSEASAFKAYYADEKSVINTRTTWFEAKVDYDFFKFKNYQLAWRWFRNLTLFFIGIPFFLEMYLRSVNRSLVKKSKELLNTVHNGVIRYNEHKIIVKPNGVIKLARPSEGGHH